VSAARPVNKIAPARSETRKPEFIWIRRKEWEELCEMLLALQAEKYWFAEKYFTEVERGLPRSERAFRRKRKILMVWNRLKNPERERAAIVAKICQCSAKHAREVIKKYEIAKRRTRA
jgi:hypothetical protein